MIVGLNGFAGAGKDTAGAYLIERYGFQHKSFAAPLKQSVANLFYITLEQIEQWKNNPNVLVQINTPDDLVADQTFRTFLQRYGTEAHRDVFGQDFWVEQAMKDLDPQQNYVFTDARFVNELQAIRLENGYSIRLVRGESAGVHASEVEPPDYLIDRWIDNTGSINELHRNLDSVMGEIGIRRLAHV